MVQPKSDVQQDYALDQHAQQREQLDGHGLFDMHDRQVRGDEVIERDQKFQVRQVKHQLAVGAPSHLQEHVDGVYALHR